MTRQAVRACLAPRARAARLLACLVFVGLLLPPGAPAAEGEPPPASPATDAAEPRGLAAYGRLSLSFEANAGQLDPEVRFVARGAGYTLFLTPHEAVFVLGAAHLPPKPGRAEPGAELPSRSGDAAPPRGSDPPAEPRGSTSTLRMRLDAASALADVVGEEELAGKIHYLRGDDPAGWHTDVPTFARVRYRDVYPGVDLVYYGNQRQLEYDLVLAADADPQQIALRFEGADGLRVDAAGALVIETPGGALQQQPPVAYQEVEGQRRAVPARYVLAGQRVTIALGAYDPSQPLVIDPLLSYSTYLGGSDADWGKSVALDTAGNAYITGHTCSVNFPRQNAGQSTFGGGGGANCLNETGAGDAFVTKLNATGTALVYSTYLGGSSNDVGSSIAVDSAGSAHIAGVTTSTNFPTFNSVLSCSSAGTHFLTKLNAAGNALVYSSCGYGGRSVALDPSGNAYTVGYTDGTVYKFNTAGTVLWGVTLNAVGLGIAVDSSGSAYVVGHTTGGLTTTLGAFETVFGGGTYDAFALKLDPAGSFLLYSTYLGGSGDEEAMGVAVDSLGNAYVTGWTSSTNFPTSGAVQASNGGGTSDAFVTKLNPTGSQLVYSTYLGGSGNGSTQYLDEVGESIVVDRAGNAYVTGITSSANFPLQSPLQTSKRSLLLPDGFIAKLNPAGFALGYSSYLGGCGTSQAYGYGIALDGANNAYVTGVAACGLPTTSGVVQPGFAGVLDAFVVKIADVSVPPVDLQVTQSAPASVTLGNTVTYTITVTNLSAVTATGVTLRDTLPTGVNFVSATSTRGGCTRSVTVTCGIGQLTGSSSATVSLVVRPTTTGAKVNVANAVADQPDSNAANDTASRSVTVNTGSPPSADVRRVLINGDAAFTNALGVTLTLTPPAGATQMQVSNDLAFSVPTEPVSPSKSWQLAAGSNGARTVYVRFKDASSIDLGTFSDDIMLVQSATPSGAVSVAARAAANHVSVNLSATSPDLAGVQDMRLSGNPTFAGASFQPYFTSAALNPQGSDTVYVQFRDRAGNLSDTSTKLPSLALSAPQVLPGGALTASWSFLPDTTTTHWLALFEAGDDDRNPLIEQPTGTAANGAAQFAFPAALPPGAYELRLFKERGVTRYASLAVTVMGACATNVGVTVTRDGTGRLLVTVNARSGALTQVSVVGDARVANTNARIEVNGQVVTTATLPLQPGAARLDFAVRPATAGLPVTVPLAILDGCNQTWSTLVGGGAGAFDVGAAGAPQELTLTREAAAASGRAELTPTATPVASARAEPPRPEGIRLPQRPADIGPSAAPASAPPPAQPADQSPVQPPAQPPDPLPVQPPSAAPAVVPLQPSIQPPAPTPAAAPALPPRSSAVPSTGQWTSDSEPGRAVPGSRGQPSSPPVAPAPWRNPYWPPPLLPQLGPPAWLPPAPPPPYGLPVQEWAPSEAP